MIGAGMSTTVKNNLAISITLVFQLNTIITIHQKAVSHKDQLIPILDKASISILLFYPVLYHSSLKITLSVTCQH
jgi:hypothetical protein